MGLVFRVAVVAAGWWVTGWVIRPAYEWTHSIILWVIWTLMDAIIVGAMLWPSFVVARHQHKRES